MSHLKLKERSTVYLHLSIDNFEPDIMYADKSRKGEYYKVRMVPATLTQFYFSVNRLPQIRTDIRNVNANQREIPQLKILEEKGEPIPWKLNQIL